MQVMKKNEVGKKKEKSPPWNLYLRAPSLDTQPTVVPILRRLKL